MERGLSSAKERERDEWPRSYITDCRIKKIDEMKREGAGRFSQEVKSTLQLTMKVSFRCVVVFYSFILWDELSFDNGNKE